MRFHLQNGEKYHTSKLDSGRMNLLTFPFIPGEVRFKITYWVDGREFEVVRGDGREILRKSERYNFNMWSGSWSGKVQ